MRTPTRADGYSIFRQSGCATTKRRPGFAVENATKSKNLEPDPIQSDRIWLQGIGGVHPFEDAGAGFALGPRSIHA